VGKGYKFSGVGIVDLILFCDFYKLSVVKAKDLVNFKVLKGLGFPGALYWSFTFVNSQLLAPQEQRVRAQGKATVNHCRPAFAMKGVRCQDV
jgi:hypothetical protein